MQQVIHNVYDSEAADDMPMADTGSTHMHVENLLFINPFSELCIHRKLAYNYTLQTLVAYYTA